MEFFLISFSACLLLVQKRAKDFYVNLCPATLPKVFIRSRHILVECLGCFN
jgi:hypothetical protein